MEDLELYSSVLFNRQGECWTPKTKVLRKKFLRIFHQCSFEGLVNSKTSMLICLLLANNQYLVSLSGLCLRFFTINWCFKTQRRKTGILGRKCTENPCIAKQKRNMHSHPGKSVNWKNFFQKDGEFSALLLNFLTALGNTGYLYQYSTSIFYMAQYGLQNKSYF